MKKAVQKTPGSKLMQSLGKREIAAALAALVATQASAQSSGQTSAQSSAQESVALEEVVVVGIAKSLSDALNQKRDADTFVDAIVAEDIGKLPDDNIAETLARVSGIQLERESGEGVNVTIRGIRENRTEVNGRTLISAEGRGSNAGLFNYFPSEIVGSVKVTKLLTADMTDGALGGTINILTRKPLDYDGLWGGASIERTYNDLNSDEGTRASALFSTTFGDNRMGILLGATYEDRPITEDSVYSNGDWRSDVTVPSSWTLPNASDPSIYYMYDVRYQRRRETREKSAVNAAFQWQPTDNLDINADVLYAEYEYDRSRAWLSAQMAHPRQNKITNPVITEHNHLVAGDVSNATIGTDHEGYQAPQSFITGGINATWTHSSGLKVFAELAHTKAERTSDQQNMSMVQTGNAFSFDLVSADVPLINIENLDLDPLNYGVQGLYDRRTINEADENSFRLDVQYPLQGFFNKISAGVRVSDVSALETYIAKRGVSVDPNTGLPTDWHTAEATSMVRAGIPTQSPSNFDWAMAALRPVNLSRILPGTGLRLPAQMIVLDTHYIGNGGFGYSDVFYDAPFEKFPERTSTVEDTISALYLRADFDVAGWQGNIGVRYAETKTTIDNFALAAGGYVPFHKSGSYSDVLPSLVVKKNLLPDVVFRFGVGETITRPPTNILGAVGRINLVIDDPTTPENEADSSTASLPNPDLKPQRGTNYDASLEWYFADTSAVALGVFYKSLDNQIDTGFKKSGTIDGYGDQVFLITTPTNIPGGWIRGLEIAYQQRFDFLPGLLANTGASINYTYLESETDDVDPRTNEKLPIRGMSENSINAQVYYEDERLSVRLLYNLRDNYYDRLDPYSRGTAIWTKGQPSLDAAIRYRFTDYCSLEFQAVNLLDSPEEEFAGFEQYINSYDLNGVRYSLGLSLKM